MKKNWQNVIHSMLRFRQKMEEPWFPNVLNFWRKCTKSIWASRCQSRWSPDGSLDNHEPNNLQTINTIILNKTNLSINSPKTTTIHLIRFIDPYVRFGNGMTWWMNLFNIRSIWRILRIVFRDTLRIRPMLWLVSKRTGRMVQTRKMSLMRNLGFTVLKCCRVSVKIWNRNRTLNLLWYTKQTLRWSRKKQRKNEHSCQRESKKKQPKAKRTQFCKRKWVGQITQKLCSL